MSVIEERGQSELMREVLDEKDECLHDKCLVLLQVDREWLGNQLPGRYVYPCLDFERWKMGSENY